MPVQPVGGRGRPSRAVWETRCTMVGRSWTDGPRVFDAAGRVHRRSGGVFELCETGLETIGRRAGIVCGGPARATGFPLKMRGRAWEPWLAHLK